MEDYNKRFNYFILFMIIAFVIIGFFVGVFTNIKDGINEIKTYYEDYATKDTYLNIISSSENEDLEDIIKNYASSNGYTINIEYAGTLDIMQKLNEKNNLYDAIWLSNSIWMYMLDDSVKTSDSKCTSINPVIFAIKESKAKELGFIDNTVYTKDIVKAISDGKLKFSMSNPTSTNSGASAYLGLISTLAGNPEVLTQEILEDEQLQEKLINLFSGMERSSGSEDFLEEMFLNGDYEAVVTYESSIININQKLETQGKETLYAIYPVDGVSIADSPFAFISTGNNGNRKEIFTELQSYILSNEGQKLLQQKGRRTWYGGVSNTVDKNLFNPNWGIDTTKYISPVKYPNTKVIKIALNMYQSELRKPTHVVFCLDYSGSMIGTGYSELVKAMDYILTDESAEKDFIQFSSRDKIDIIPFNGEIIDRWTTTKGDETEKILENIHSLQPSGSTAIYPVSIQALEILKNEDIDKYNLSIVLMTDGEGNVGRYKDLANEYTTLNKQIPIYSIMFGSASEKQLSEIANLSNGKVFNGKVDLVKAFKEVRGYN